MEVSILIFLLLAMSYCIMAKYLLKFKRIYFRGRRKSCRNLINHTLRKNSYWTWGHLFLTTSDLYIAVDTLYFAIKGSHSFGNLINHRKTIWSFPSQLIRFKERDILAITIARVFESILLLNCRWTIKLYYYLDKKRSTPFLKSGCERAKSFKEEPFIGK